MSSLKLIHVETMEYPVTLAQFKSRFPQVVFPQTIQFEDYGYAAVFPTPSPTPSLLQLAVEVAPVLSNKGFWEQQWTLQDKFQDIVADGVVVTTKAAQEQAAIEDSYEHQYVAVATQAEEVLADTLKAGFTFNNILWHCDNVFQSQIQAYALGYLAGVIAQGATVPVRDKMNVTHQLSSAQITALASALMTHVQSAYATCWATKDAFVPV